MLWQRAVARPRALGLIQWFALWVGLLASPIAKAEDDARVTLNGSWSASSLTEVWSTDEWGEPCGPKPQGQGAPGGTVQVTEIGSELAIAGAGRTFTTAECWEQMPGLARTSHSASGNLRGWKTRCATSPGDPRQAIVVNSMSATDNTITMVEIGNYQFAIKGQVCKASVSRSRSFKIISRAGDEPEPVKSAEPEPPPPPPPPPPAPVPEAGACDEPGDPARLEIRPARKLMRPGETYTFKSFVTDANGCALGRAPSFRSIDGPLSADVTVTAKGEVRVAEGAGEGALEIVAEIEGKGATVFVEVASPENYAALLSARGFNAAGEEDAAAVAIIATRKIGGREGVADDSAGRRKQLFVAIVGGIAALLGLAGFVLLRRGRKPTELERETSLPPAPNVQLFDAAAAAGGAMRCPTCGDDFPTGGTFCPKDGAALVPVGGDSTVVGGVGLATAQAVAASGAPSVAPPASTSPGSAAPASAAPAPASAAPASVVGKVCPKCGAQYPADTTFCGEDGMNLVPINRPPPA